MKTIRTYLNLARADLDKSVLEAGGISVFLAGEESLRLGYGMATGPVLLQVDEADADEAEMILETEFDHPLPGNFAPPGAVPTAATEPDNPNLSRMWALLLLVLGALVLALVMLPKRHEPAPPLPNFRTVP
jgi:hypothetical protein